MRRLWRDLWVPAVLLASGALPSACAQSAGDTVYPLRGTVVDGLTGKPLSRALVRSADGRLGAMTDAQGRFGLEVRVPARPGGAPQGCAQASINYAQAISASGGIGASAQTVGFSASCGSEEVYLSAKKPGFLDPEQAVPVSFRNTDALGSIKLKLMPAAGVAGRISAEGKDAAVQVRVTLLRRQVQEGLYRWQQSGFAVTDSQGEFHFTNLRAGEYTIMSAEWRGEEPVAAAPGEVAGEYPPVFYGDAADLLSAGKLALHTGETAHADLHLHQVPYYAVTVPVAVAGPRTGVIVQVEGEGKNPGFSLGYDPRRNAVEGALPNGSYTLSLQSFGAQPAFATVPLHVEGAPVQTAAVTLAPGPEIPVRIHAALTGKDRAGPLQISVFLEPTEGRGGFANGNNQPENRSEFVVKGAQPGRYVVRVQPSVGYVASLTAGGVDLLRSPLVLSGSGAAEPIDVTVRDDGGAVTGKVTGVEPSSTFRPVLLLPTGSGGQFRQAFAGPDGTFNLGNIPPGNYRAFALDTPRNEIPYRDLEAMRVFDGKGVALSVASGAPVQVDVPLLGEAEGQVP